MRIAADSLKSGPEGMCGCASRTSWTRRGIYQGHVRSQRLLCMESDLFVCSFEFFVRFSLWLLPLEKKLEWVVASISLSGDRRIMSIHGYF
jgi:hypothetical protein